MISPRTQSLFLKKNYDVSKTYKKNLENSITFILGNKINIVEASWPFFNLISPYTLPHQGNYYPKFGVCPFHVCIDTITLGICIPKL